MGKYRKCAEYKTVFSKALGKEVKRCARYTPLTRMA